MPGDGEGCAANSLQQALDHEGLVDSDREAHKAKRDPDLRCPDQPSDDVHLAARQQASAPRIEQRQVFISRIDGT